MNLSKEQRERIPNGMLDNQPYLDAVWRFDVDHRCVAEFAHSGAYKSELGHICICGHPELVHATFGCRLSDRRACGCKKFDDYGVVENIRHFFRVTQGVGVNHALGLGLENLRRDGNWEVVDRRICKCQSTAEALPVTVGARGNISYFPNKKNIFLCQACIDKRLYKLRDDPELSEEEEQELPLR